MSSLLLLRNSNNAVLSRCVSLISRVHRVSNGSSFDLRQKKGITSQGSFGGVDDDIAASSRSTSYPAPPNPDDFARVASGAAVDVARVVNQLNSV